MKIPEISEPNDKYIKLWIKEQRMSNLKAKTIETKIWRIYPLIQFTNNIDLADITKEDLEDFYLARQEKVTPRTLWNEITELKRFFSGLNAKNVAVLFSSIKMKRPKVTLPVDSILTPEDIQKILSVCTTQRDRAIVMLLWDTGCRVSELTDLTIGRIEFDKYGGICILDGKTGRRRARLIDSVPDLQLWINMHPNNKNPNAPLFVELRSGDHKIISIRRIQGLLNTLKKNAQIHKRVHPHAFRHARATERATVLTEREMDIRFGWQPGSMMSSTYVHLSGRDLEMKELQLAGLLEKDERPKNPLLPEKCPRCKNTNIPGAMYCSFCSMALSEDAIIEHELMMQDVANHTQLVQKSHNLHPQ